MPRKGHIAKREPLADPVYQSTLVNKFVNSMMWDGKKSTAQNIFYRAMKKLEDKGGAVLGDQPAAELFAQRPAAPARAPGIGLIDRGGDRAGGVPGPEHVGAAQPREPRAHDRDARLRAPAQRAGE